jgi:outer membrane protein assembly factor BamE (lipoprotein component of BamABCDE complex)
MTVRLLLLAACLAAAPACTRSRITLGVPVRPAEAAAIVPGLSKAAVLTRLGPPDHVEVEPGGSAFEYLYSHTAARTLDVSLFQSSFTYGELRLKIDRLRVSFDTGGAVRHVGVVVADDAPSPPGAGAAPAL